MSYRLPPFPCFLYFSFFWSSSHFSFSLSFFFLLPSYVILSSSCYSSSISFLLLIYLPLVFLSDNVYLLLLFLPFFSSYLFFPLRFYWMSYRLFPVSLSLFLLLFLYFLSLTSCFSSSVNFLFCLPSSAVPSPSSLLFSFFLSHVLFFLCRLLFDSPFSNFFLSHPLYSVLMSSSSSCLSTIHFFWSISSIHAYLLLSWSFRILVTSTFLHAHLACSLPLFLLAPPSLLTPWFSYFFLAHSFSSSPTPFLAHPLLFALCLLSCSLPSFLPALLSCFLLISCSFPSSC